MDERRGYAKAAAGIRSTIPFEFIEKAWFGSRARGKRMLASAGVRPEPLPPREFIDFLRSRFADASAAVHFIRFHRAWYTDRKEEWDQRFAVCFTDFSWPARHRLYEDAEQITRETGWYPLVTGARVNQPDSRSEPLSHAMLRRLLRDQTFGQIREIAPCSTAGAGTSIRICCDRSEILLDLGFNGDKTKSGTVAVLSHAHADHAGGLGAALRNGTTVICSSAVRKQLKRKVKNVQVAAIEPPIEFDAADGTKIACLPGAHNAGSMMVRIRDVVGHEIVYSGDYCLSNAYYRQRPDTVLQLFSPYARTRTLILDATFVGRRLDGLGSLAELEHACRVAHEKGEHLFFAAESADYLYQLYLWFFRHFYRGAAFGRDRFLLVSRDILAELQATFGTFIRREHHAYDPFLKGILGVESFAYLESARLFPLDTTSALLPPGPFDVFCVGSQLKAISGWFLGSTLYWVGKQSPMIQSFSTGLNRLGPKVVRLEGPDFSFHSAARDVAAIVDLAHRAGIRVLLFHNEESRIRTGLSSLHVSPAAYECLSTRPVSMAVEQS